jgi:hypothetical protein
MFKILGESCHNGPCPTFRRDDHTGDVEVQGYRTTASCPIPDAEDVVLIPEDAWARLLADLPLGMLLRALSSRLLRRTPTARPVPVGR